MQTGRLLADERLCRAVLGLSGKALLQLEASFGQALWQAHKNQPERQRAVGGGRRGHLSTVRAKLVFILVYLKCYPTFDVLGWLFGMDRSRACRRVHQLLPVLEAALGRECVLPARQIRSASEFLQAFPGAQDVFLDGTERPVQKPGNGKRRRKTYSGKKKQTTRKFLVLTNEQRGIGWLSRSKSGRRHDKRLLDKEDLLRHVPPDVTLWADTGFQGIAQQHPNTQMPCKGTKKQPLTAPQKQNNRVIAGIRVVVEHAIAGIKRLACMAQVYRNRLPKVDDRFALLSCGLWNFFLRTK